MKFETGMSKFRGGTTTSLIERFLYTLDALVALKLKIQNYNTANVKNMKDIFDGPERVKIRSSSVLYAIKVSASYLMKSCGALLTRWYAVTKLS